MAAAAAGLALSCRSPQPTLPPPVAPPPPEKLSFMKQHEGTAAGELGPVDGANVVFSLSARPISNEAVCVFRNGLYQREGQDYRLEAQTLTFADAPAAADSIDVQYSV